jgi:hypothetical protein
MRRLTRASSARSISEMGRRRARELPLPPHVHKAMARGKLYFCFQQGRGRAEGQRGKRQRIHGDPYAPAGSPSHTAFWSEVARLSAADVVYPAGTIGNLIERYRADDAYSSLAPSTKRTYDVTLNRFARPGAWGILAVNDLTPLAVAPGRDALADTPVLANQMIAVGRGYTTGRRGMVSRRSRTRSQPSDQSNSMSADTSRGHSSSSTTSLSARLKISRVW